MKLVTWNVNGLRACMNKGFKESMEKLDADIPAIMNIGTVPLKKATPERPSFPGSSPFP